MIIADRKPLAEIQEMIADKRNILVVGCKGCVTVCNVGGLKEVEILSSALRIGGHMDGVPRNVAEAVLERQCDPEYIDQLKDQVGEYDAVISMACGVGPQFLSEAYPDQLFYPAVNTRFIGGAVQHGVWAERCAGCGTCIIHHYDGLCPIARCSKSLQHGPCGGSAKGKCEISDEVICIWDEIVRKKMEKGRVGDLRRFNPAKDWRSARDGGPRTSIREELAS